MRFGFAAAKAPGYEADDFLAAAVVGEEAPLAEPVLVVTSDRDAFQLASERVTLLMPTRGVSELARVGPPRCASATASSPSRCPTSSRSEAIPPTSFPGAPGVGPKGAAQILQEHGSLEAALEAGRFAPIAEELRLYRRIATLDASAPLPPLEDQSPLWAEASSLLSSWGMGQMAERIAARAE